MQTYQSYYPQMNNGYMYPYNPQQPYMDRIAGLQQFQQSLQQPQTQQQFQQMTQSINGRIVPNAESIAANDVPMDGSVAFFPMQDMSQILAKSWNADGTIKTIIYKKFLSDPNNSSFEQQKAEIDLSESVTAIFNKRFDELEKRLDELGLTSAKYTNKSTTSRTKKESEVE